MSGAHLQIVRARAGARAPTFQMSESASATNFHERTNSLILLMGQSGGVNTQRDKYHFNYKPGFRTASLVSLPVCRAR